MLKIRNNQENQEVPDGLSPFVYRPFNENMRGEGGGAVVEQKSSIRMRIIFEPHTFDLYVHEPKSISDFPVTNIY